MIYNIVTVKQIKQISQESRNVSWLHIGKPKLQKWIKLYLKVFFFFSWEIWNTKYLVQA